MKWNDVELIDGEFYFVDVTRWRDNEPNEWVFVYKENCNYVTEHYCAARINQVDGSLCSIYDNGHVCGESAIIDLRPATQEDINRFWVYLDRWNYRYNLNTKSCVMLEEGKIYIVKVNSGNVWLFKKYRGVLHAHRQNSCSHALCLEDMYKAIEEVYVCRDNEIVWIKPANENHIAIWNREFNDNVEL